MTRLRGGFTRLVLIVVVLAGMTRGDVMENDGKEDEHRAVAVDAMETMFRDDPGMAAAERISAAVQSLYIDTDRSAAALANASDSCGRPFQTARNAWTTFAECNGTQCELENGWIRTVLDSQGRRPSGIEFGNRYWLGEYRECLSVSSGENGTFLGQYCKAAIPTETIGDVLLGICAPNTCTGDDIYGAVSRLTHFDQFSISCGENKPELAQDPSAIAAITGCCLILSILILSTTIDGVLLWRFMKSSQTTHNVGNVLDLGLHRTQVDGGPLKCLLAFSVLSNGARLLTNSDTPGQIRCLHGMRVLSFVWVVMFHSMISGLKRPRQGMWDPLDNTLYLPKEGNIITVAFLTGAFGTDTFFMMSGLVLAYNWLKRIQLDSLKSPCYWLKFWIRRYIRLTPVYALLLWIYSELYYYMSSGGPLWPEETHLCRENWWRNLLYINNFDSEWKCMIHTWYLASEFQYHLLSPLILIPLAVFPKLAIGLGAVLVVGDGISRGVYYGVNNLPPVSLQGLSDQYNQNYWEAQISYMRPYRRAGPYVMGLLLGYVLFTMKNNHRRHGWQLKLAMWLGFFLVAFFSGAFPYAPTVPAYPQWAIGVHSGLCRIVLAFFLGWTIYSCETGNAGVLNRFLSWKGFRFFAPLTYCAYLVHYIAYLYIFQSSDHPPHFDSNLSFAFDTVKCIALTLPFAIILHLSMEVPAMELERMIFNKAPKTKKPPTPA